MPIDPSTAIGAELPAQDFTWSASDVLLYHLALGAGADPVDPRELRYTIEDGLQVLPSFAVVAQTVHRFEPPAVEYPGISIDLAKVLHIGNQYAQFAPWVQRSELLIRVHKGDAPMAKGTPKP